MAGPDSPGVGCGVGSGTSSKQRRKRHQTKPHRCKICEKRFQTKGGLNIHLKLHFPKTYLIRCPEPDCDFSNVQKANFVKHLAVVHGKTVGGGILPETFQCAKCPFRTLTEVQLKQHALRNHSQDKPFKCNSCSYATVEKAALAKHFRIRHTSKRPFPCDSCARRFATSSALARHARSHTGEKPHQCIHPGCFKEFADLKRLKAHNMMHNGLKPHQCEQCEYRTNRKDNLKLHVRRNHSET